MLPRWGDRRAVLFDLDGTLADTAADLCAAANAMRLAEGLDALPLARFRPYVSRGGRAMLEIAFPHWDEPRRAAALAEFLDRYGQAPAQHSRLFAGMPAVLAAIEGAGLPWGIVTNKPIRLAEPVVQGLGLAARCGVLLGGDSLAERKPHPLPLQVACARLGVAPASALYVGDDLRDVQAAQAAGMPVLGAAWGYLTPDDDIAGWGADAVLANPIDLLDALGLPTVTA
jgi:N-acetyl-D-muramate 6-phosphate phosphatase